MLGSDRITVDEAAALLGVSPIAVQEDIKNGRITAHRVRSASGDVYLIERHVLDSIRRERPNAQVASPVDPVATQRDPEGALLERKSKPSPDFAARQPEGASKKLTKEQRRRAELEKIIEQLEDEVRSERAEQARLAHLVQKLEGKLAASEKRGQRLTDQIEREAFIEQRRRTDLEQLVQQEKEKLANEQAHGAQLLLHIRELEEKLVASQEQVRLLAGQKKGRSQEQARGAERERLIEQLEAQLAGERADRAAVGEHIRQLEQQLAVSEERLTTLADRREAAISAERQQRADLEQRLQQLEDTLALEQTRAAEQGHHVRELEEKLTGEHRHTVELERVVRQLKGELATAQKRLTESVPQRGQVERADREHVPAPVDESQTTEQVQAARMTGPTCPFLRVSDETGASMCASQQDDLIGVSTGYAAVFCLTSEHVQCGRFVSAVGSKRL